MSKYKKLLNDSVLFGISDFATKFVQFALMPLFTIVLTTSEYGEVELIINIVELLIPVLSLGLIESVFRFSIDSANSKRSILSNSMVISIMGLLFLSIIFMFFKNQINNIYYVYVSLLYLIKIVSLNFGQFARGAGYLRVYTFASVNRAVSLAISAFILLLVYKLGITGYLASIFISELIYILTLIAYKTLKNDVTILSMDKKLLKKMILYSLPTVPNVTFLWINQLAGRYIIATFLGLEQAGLYVAASKVPALINIISSIFLQTWTIAAAKNVNSEDKSTFNSTVYVYYSMIVQLAVSGLLLVLPFISLLLLQNDFFNGAHYSALLIYSALFNCYSAYFGAFFGAAMNNRMLMVSSIVGGAVNIILSFALIGSLGIIGILVSTVISSFIILFLRYYYTRGISLVKIKWSHEIIVWSILLIQSLLITFSKFNLTIIQFMLFIIILYLNKSIVTHTFKLFFRKL